MSETVKVIVRIRPMNRLEFQKNSKEIATVDQQSNQIILHKPSEENYIKNFAYDAVYPQNCTQAAIYEQSVFNLVESVVQGYNGTIFAYGQTGCGKTFTMMGNPEKEELKGIIPLNIIESAKDRQFLVTCSFMEIYNQEIHDLLGGDIKAKKQIKQNEKGVIEVKDLSKHIVKSVAEMDKWMMIGFKNRAVGQTVMNKDSSRSHSIFTIRVESEFMDQNGERFTAGKLNLVDLAGSERQSKTKAEGERLKQATKINLSLSALGNVISALVDDKATHIPYRDSKLTRLLQDSLGGNTKTIMIANISPADYNFEETLSTLRYASRAKFIKNKPIVNEDPKDAMLRQYAEQIKKLKEMLENGGKLNASQIDHVHTLQKDIDPDVVHQLEKKYSEELQQKQDLLQREKIEKERIEEMMKVLEQQMIKGGENIDSVEVKKYKEMKQKVKKQRSQKQKILAQKQSQQHQMYELKMNYNSLQEQVQQYKRIINQLRDKYINAQQDAHDIEKQNISDRDELLETIREQDRDIKFYQGIAAMLLKPEQIETIRAECGWNKDTTEFKIPAFYLRQKKLVLPKLREMEALDMIDNEKSRKQLRFEKQDKSEKAEETPYRKIGSVGGLDFEQIPSRQYRQSERQKKYLIPSNRNFDSYEKTYSSNNLNADIQFPPKPKTKNVLLTPINSSYVQPELKGKKILQPISPNLKKRP